MCGSGSGRTKQSCDNAIGIILLIIDVPHRSFIMSEYSI